MTGYIRNLYAILESLEPIVLGDWDDLTQCLEQFGQDNYMAKVGKWEIYGNRASNFDLEYKGMPILTCHSFLVQEVPNLSDCQGMKELVQIMRKVLPYYHYLPLEKKLGLR